MYNNEMESQNRQASEIAKSVIDLLDDTRDEASMLNKLELSSFAEKSAEIIFKGLDEIKSKLLELAQTQKINALSNHIRHSMSSVPLNRTIY